MKTSTSVFLTTLVAVSALAQTPRVSGVEPGAIYNHPVTVNVADRSAFPRAKLFLNGEPFPDGGVVSKDGTYSLEVRESDELGRERAHPPVVFTIDTTPPLMKFVYPDGGKSGGLPEVEVFDANEDPEALRLFLDGRPYHESEPLPPGEHLFEAMTRDRAHNWAQASLTVSVSSGGCQPTEYVWYRSPLTKLTAAHYYAWYSQATCPGNSKWCHCVWQPKPGNPRPALGFYGSNSSATVNAHIQQMVANGIDVIAVEWNGNAYETSNFFNAVLPAINANPVQFVLLYDRNVWDLSNSDNRNKLISDFQNFASSTSHFKHPKYLKFNNKPVVYFYLTRAVRGEAQTVKNTFDAMHQAASANGFAGLFLVADHLWWQGIDWTKLQLMRPSAVTAFCPVTSGRVPEDDSRRPVRAWANQLVNMYNAALTPLQQYFGNDFQLVNLDVGIFPQFDSHGLERRECFSRSRTEAWHLLDSSDWDYMIGTSGTAAVAEEVVVLDDCRKVRFSNSNYTSIVWTYSFNEWYEGAGIEQLAVEGPNVGPPFAPGYPYDFGQQLLQVLKQRLP